MSPQHEKPKFTASACCPPKEQLVNLYPESNATHRKRPWINGQTKTAVGDMPVVETTLSFKDKIGSWKVRWGFGRMKYRVDPGLYAVGSPGDNSPVFVSANYKLSFDKLRGRLNGIDGWVLVLDTRGINVWCAAGKGTFGTNELIARIKMTQLDRVVSHRRVILPQLAGPGVSAHHVKERCGFRVVYGPVRARDIGAFLDNNMKATARMRRVKFGLWDRAVLVPNDFLGSIKYPLIIGALLFVLSGFGSDIFSVERMITNGLISAIFIIMAYAIGTILPPILLPWLPGRSFSAKGAWIGLLASVIVAWYTWYNPNTFPSILTPLAWILIFPAVSSFIAMNFTGSSTYTSLSGVLREMRVALPLQIGTAVIGLGLWITGLFI